MKQKITFKQIALLSLLLITSSQTHAGPPCGATPCIDGNEINLPLILIGNEKQIVSIKNKGPVGLSVDSTNIGIITGSNSIGIKATSRGSTGDPGKSAGVLGVHAPSGNFGVLGASDAGVSGYSQEGYAGLFNGKVLAKGELEIQDGGVKFQDGSIQNTASIKPQLVKLKKIFLSPPNSSNIVAPTNSNTFVGANVTCPPDYIILAGGWNHEVNNQPGHRSYRVHAYYSMPVGEGWEVGIRNDSSEYMRITIYATCVKGIQMSWAPDAPS